MKGDFKMGWNSAYEIFEKQVINAYDEGILTDILLDKIVTPYKGTDLDSGGSQGLLSKDGLNIEQIICKIMYPEAYYDAMNNPVYAKGYEPCLQNNEKFLDLCEKIRKDWNMW